MKRITQPLVTLAILVMLAGIVSSGATKAADHTIHPWHAEARSAWVTEAARRVFKLEGPPDMAGLQEICFSGCPESAYVRPEPTSPQREVHAIGVYEGSDERHAGSHSAEEVGAIDVWIRPTEKPVVLLLMSYDPVLWRIHLEEGAHLDHVRRDAHGMVELPPGAPPMQTVENLPSIYSLFSSGDAIEAGDPENALRSLERAVGYAVDSFQGSYRGTEFTVPFFHDASVVRDVAVKVRELQNAKISTMTSPFDLVIGKSLVRFNAPDLKAGRRAVVTFDRREELRGVVEVDGKFYAITEFAFFAHDPKSGTTTELHVPVGYPDPGRWSGIAHDTKKKRLIITAQSSPYAYTYDLMEGEWRLFPWDYKTRPPLFGGAITCDRAQSVFYGLTSFWPPQTQSGMVVVVLDSLLHPQRSIKLSNPDAIPFGIDPQVQLAKTGNSLVVHVHPGFFGGVGGTCLLINLLSGEVSKLEVCSPSGSSAAVAPPSNQGAELSDDDL